MLKVIAACGNGMGSSQVIKMKISKVFKKLGVDAQVDHNSVGVASSMAANYDAVFVSQNFVDQFKTAEEKGVQYPDAYSGAAVLRDDDIGDLRNVFCERVRDPEPYIFALP